MHTDLVDLTLTEARAALRDRKVKSMDLVEACLGRIERDNPVLNAFIDVRAEAALHLARLADQAVAAGDNIEPLHGLPLAHKDIFWRKGHRITGGSSILPEQIGSETATVLKRIDAAGAIDVGSLNLAEFAAGSTGHNEHYGDCRNPWDSTRMPGGSSSGSAAAVAGRMVYGSLGSDTGGSIRNPAAFCGLYGLRPTSGAVSRRGSMPRSWTLDTIGPLARTASDAVLLFSVIAGRDPDDPSTAAAPDTGDYPLTLPGSVSDLRLGVPDALMHQSDMDGEVEAALGAALAVLERSVVHSMQPVVLPDFERLFTLGDIILKCEAASMHGAWLRQRSRDYGRTTLTRIEPGLFIPATRYLEAMAQRGRWLRRYLDEVFDKVDLVILPGPTLPALLLQETEFTSADSVARLVGRITLTSRPVSYLGLPSLNVPCGFTAQGLPIGFQVIGRPFAEASLFALAEAYERETEWPRRIPAPPQLDAACIG